LNQFNNEKFHEDIIPICRDDELIVIGTLIHDFENAVEFVNEIKLEYFHDLNHRIIFRAINKLLLNEKVNPQSIINYLTDIGKLDQIGGAYFITWLYDFNLISQLPQSIQRLTEVYRRREYYELGRKLNNSYQIKSNEIEKLIFDAVENIESNSIGGYVEINKSIDVLLDDMTERFENGTPPGISTGFNDLDEIITGFEPGDLIIIGACTSHGKTALGLNIGVNIAKQGLPVAVVSLEMPSNQLNQRLICSEAKLDCQKAKNNELSNKEMNRFFKLAESVKEYPIYIDESRNNTISKIITRAKLQCKRKKIKVLIIDYLQLIKIGDTSENRNLELSEITMALKRFALQENITVLCLAQLNRKASGKAPLISELRDSGAIEQDADKVILLWRPEQDGIQGKEDFTGVALLNIAKNRNGMTGKIKLSFNAKSISFRDYSYYGGFND